MYRKDHSIIKVSIYLVFISLFFSACEETGTFKYYNFDFYPIKEYKNSGIWSETRFISGDTIAFQLNSFKIMKEFHDFEPIKISTCKLFTNKNFIVNEDTIKPGTNLLNRLNSDMISFSLDNGNSRYDWYYLIIKSTKSAKLNLSNGYYQFHFIGETKNGFEINDSLLVKCNNK